jgi:hypothetical protein
MNSSDLNLEDFAAPVDTIAGTEKDSVFFVIARAKGLVLALRPLVMVVPMEDSTGVNQPVVCVGARLRIEAEDAKASVSDGEAVFGILGFVTKGMHASQVIRIPMGSQYYLSPGLMPNLLEELDPAYKIVLDLQSRLGVVGVETTLSAEDIQDILKVSYCDYFVMVEPCPVDSNTVEYGTQIH